jgi:hypothetical protein
MEVVARCRDTALRYARRRPMIVVGLGEHHLSPGYRGRPPRSHLERVKRGNPSGSSLVIVAGLVD